MGCPAQCTHTTKTLAPKLWGRRDVGFHIDRVDGEAPGRNQTSKAAKGVAGRGGGPQSCLGVCVCASAKHKANVAAIDQKADATEQGHAHERKKLPRLGYADSWRRRRQAAALAGKNGISVECGYW